MFGFVLIYFLCFSTWMHFSFTVFPLQTNESRAHSLNSFLLPKLVRGNCKFRIIAVPFFLFYSNSQRDRWMKPADRFLRCGIATDSTGRSPSRQDCQLFLDETAHGHSWNSCWFTLLFFPHVPEPCAAAQHSMNHSRVSQHPKYIYFTLALFALGSVINCRQQDKN